MINTLKQDLRTTREDPRDQVKSKHEDRNQAVRKIAKKRAGRGDRTLDRTLEARPELDRWLGRQATGREDRTLAATDRTQKRSVRSSTVRFQSGKSTTGRVQWQATGRWLASDQYIVSSMVGMTGRIRSG